MRSFALSPGDLFYLATYELTVPSQTRKVTTFGAKTAGAPCAYILGEDIFRPFERPVCSAAALEGVDGSWEVATAASVSEEAR